MKDEIREKRKHKRLGEYFANTLYGGMYREMRGGVTGSEPAPALVEDSDEAPSLVEDSDEAPSLVEDSEVGGPPARQPLWHAPELPNYSMPDTEVTLADKSLVQPARQPLWHAPELPNYSMPDTEVTLADKSLVQPAQDALSEAQAATQAATTEKQRQADVKEKQELKEDTKKLIGELPEEGREEFLNILESLDAAEDLDIESYKENITNIRKSIQDLINKNQQELDALLKSNPNSDRDKSIKIFEATINHINDLEILKKWARDLNIDENIKNNKKFIEAEKKASSWGGDKTELIQLYKKYIIYNYEQNFQNYKCDDGIYNLDTCNLETPCSFNDMCQPLSKQASFKPRRSSLRSNKDTSSVVDDDNPLLEQLKNIDFSGIESNRNNIERRINSIKTEDDKYEVERKIAQYNRDYDLLKNKISLIKRTIRAKNLSDDEIITELNDKNEKLLYYKSYTQFFRNMLNSVRIKRKDRKDDKRYGDDRRRDDRRDNRDNRDRRDDRRDDELNRRLQKYDQEQKDINKLNKEIERDRPKRPEGMPQGMQGIQQQPQRPQGMQGIQQQPERPQGMQGMPERPQGIQGMQQPQGVPQQKPQGVPPGQIPGQKGIDPRNPKMTFKKGIDKRGQEQRPGQPGQPPKRLKDIDREKYVFERKGEKGQLLPSKYPRKERPDVKRFDKKVENKYVPDVKIDKYAVNDLMHILKDVKHSDKDKFYNILNNEYLYRNSNIDEYLLNIDNYLLDRYRLFMERLSKDNTQEEKLAIIQLLTEVNRKPKRKTINKRNK